METMEALPVAAALDRESLREIVKAVVADFARQPGPALMDRITDAIWPLLDQAGYWHKRWTAALERADEDGVQIISQHVRTGELERRAEAAEAKLAAITKAAETWAALAPADDWGETPGSTVAADIGRAILAIIGTEGKARHE